MILKTGRQNIEMEYELYFNWNKFQNKLILLNRQFNKIYQTASISLLEYLQVLWILVTPLIQIHFNRFITMELFIC